MDVLSKYMDALPAELVDYIKEYIPSLQLVFLNRTYYTRHHPILRRHISDYERYVRETIRRDHAYVFDRISEENIDAWIQVKKYPYKHMMFNNYIYFMLYFCNECGSSECREVVMRHLQKRDLCRNLHKKNLIKYIKWKK